MGKLQEEFQKIKLKLYENTIEAFVDAFEDIERMVENNENE